MVDSSFRQHARRLLDLVRDELTVSSGYEGAGACVAWQDGGEEKALEALEEALSNSGSGRTPDPGPRPPSSPSRHFSDEAFPDRCDHCPVPLDRGTAYRRVQLVADGSDSFVGGEECKVEMSWELVLCRPCFERLSHWVQHPLGEPLEELPLELDDAALAEELAKEEFILRGEEGDRGPGAGVRSGRKSEHGEPAVVEDRARQLAAPCAHHPGVDCGCYCRFVGCSPRTCPEEGDRGPGAGVRQERNIEELIERSSLGTPEAQALRQSVPVDVVRQVLSRAEALGPACPIHGSVHDLLCYSCHMHRHGPAVRPEFARAVESASRALSEYRATRPEPCLDPEKMHGFCDQFGGTDDPEDHG